MTHTPGPWTVSTNQRGVPTVASSQFFNAHDPLSLKEFKEPKNICRVMSYWSPEEVAANASLIAAAPDLLNAAKLIADTFPIDEWPDYAEELTALQNAIKKAA
jgi:hypothetical protein